MGTTEPEKEKETETEVMEHFPYWAMILIAMFYVLLPPVYYAVKLRIHPDTSFKLRDYYIMCLLLVFLVTGGYQLYFWCQKAPLNEVSEISETVVDRAIPKIEAAVYVYNLIYYIGFGMCIIAIYSYTQFANMLFIALGLLLVHAIVFIIFPTKLPANSREKKKDENTFLELTQNIDTTHNAFPSAHVSLSILVYFITRGVFGPAAILFPIAITLSCLFTKQHYMIDCVGGALLGILYCLFIIAVYPHPVFR